MRDITRTEPDCSYAQVEMDDWSSLAIEDNRLVGHCPRCGHFISRPLEGKQATTFAPIRKMQFEGPWAHTPPNPLRVKIVLRCNCDQAHKGGPEGKFGCGAYGGKWVTM
jgi:hypothetical protein